MEVDYNMLVQNHVHYNLLFKKITLWGDGVMIKKLDSSMWRQGVQVPTLTTLVT
jgi:hypothetical protein